MKVVEKIKALRKVMQSHRVSALIVPSADPHQSEVVLPRWQARQWASGFTGSAGTLVITQQLAGVWTDGRYFIQAARELKGSGIRLFKAREPGVPTLNDWILQQIKPGQVVACDGRVFSLQAIREMKRAFAVRKITVKTNLDLVGQVWKDRPAASSGTTAFDFPIRFAGKSRSYKLGEVRSWLKTNGADALLLASLDDIAWLFNIRGSGGAASPVVMAYALVESRRAILFTDPLRVPRSLANTLRKAGITIRPYDSIARFLKGLVSLKSLVLHPGKITQALADALPGRVRLVEVSTDITTELKAVKNPVEQGNFREAALLDGVALVKFMAWLESEIKAGGCVTEFEAGVKLAGFRAESPEYKGDSFSAICAYQGNAAMAHYSAQADASARLCPKGLFLVDSGGNYFQGTMDTTRTIALGKVSAAARRCYTLVLKGVIALSRAQFPEGTTGTHLDALAREPLWAAGLNFRHGSGHGVGSYLNVHEGPHGISPVWNPVTLKPGMVVTIEPGVYVEGQFGIRTENMVLVVPDQESAHGRFLRFETLTVCPIDTTPLVLSQMTPDEKQWLNAYHQVVWRRLSPHLASPEKHWLRQKTKPV